MTPEERNLVTQLFDRLATLEAQPRDPTAERAVIEGLGRAPHAVYYLVQTVLVQDEALKVANARLKDYDQRPQDDRGFLDTARTQYGQRGSVPPVGGQPGGYRDDPPPRRGPWQSGPLQGGAYQSAPAGGGPWQSGPVGGGYAGAEPARSAGGSFLGTAAATAAGMVGGGLLLGGIRNMLGGHTGGGPFSGAFDQLGGHAGGHGAFGGDSSFGGSGDLSRDAGLNDIGSSGTAFGGSGGDQYSLASNDDSDDSLDSSDDFDGDSSET